MSDLTEVIFVGAKKVGCTKCIFCRECLIQKGILYSTDSQITAETAIRDNLRCSSCGSKLVTEEQFKHRKQAAKCTLRKRIV